ncbi:uncharacterized protein LOC125487807 [Rhincodon typus]|uniref:uncharacterized protein LOC125487807 n=1 Tax=Rhincodon typus TaxID=259920 RepID=UPI00202E4292|nr:uncharacterized protein LOC125487807 [Rhincodon typus]
MSHILYKSSFTTLFSLCKPSWPRNVHMNYNAGSYAYVLLTLLWMTNIFEIGQTMCKNEAFEVKATCGDPVILPCHFSGVSESASVIWQKSSNGNDLVVHVAMEDSIGDGQNAWYKNRTMLRPDWHRANEATLTLKHVMLNDSGTYFCYVRLNHLKSLICSTVSLGVNPDTDVFWPAHFEVRVKHGEELNFQWGLNLRCVGTEGLGVTCGPSNSTDRCHFELRKAGTTAVAQSENHVLILEEAGGIGTFRVPGFSSVQPGGTIECCLENVGAGTEMCARSRVNVIGSTNGTDSAHRGCHQLLNLLLLAFVTVVLRN